MICDTCRDCGQPMLPTESRASDGMGAAYHANQTDCIAALLAALAETKALLARRRKAPDTPMTLREYDAEYMAPLKYGPPTGGKP